MARHLVGNRADAENAVQDAFLSAWRRLPEFRHGASLGTWMYRIVTNRCLNTMRHRPRPLPLDSVPEPAAADAHSSAYCASKAAGRSGACRGGVALLRVCRQARRRFRCVGRAGWATSCGGRCR
ncbi:RNA polymerase sigma factor [Streptomyces sp. NPDC090445]|uniref:RNA polymerase sigma factor n=1 Tax=Streptomyces sp. NPDC090445 TaxID=3365963 RepID=UPI0038300D56